MPTITTAPSVLIRAARGSDGPALERLAALDSATVPAGELLVAEADGALVAARSLTTGQAIADPFVPSADVRALLELRAAVAVVRQRVSRAVCVPAGGHEVALAAGQRQDESDRRSDQHRSHDQHLQAWGSSARHLPNGGTNRRIVTLAA